MKKIMIAAAALVAMTACNKTLIEGPVADSEYGYINFGLSSDMEIVDTKAVVSQTGDGANYNVYLKDDEQKITSQYKQFYHTFSGGNISFFKPHESILISLVGSD